MRTGTLVLVTRDGTQHSLEMFVFSWVNSTGTSTNRRWLIEISARNPEIGQLLLHIKTTGTSEDRVALSAFHDKLLAALASSLDTQITAYTDGDTLPENLVEVNLKRNLVYLLIS
ncbi:MAG: hypothetical protein H7Z16_07275 [Pyrinomonadaceae bacterium]|nr:hypothetical protein [Pyrinomonadaceae bacterium]